MRRLLKRNQSGHATFLPLTVINLDVCSVNMRCWHKNLTGYLGVATDFTECEETFYGLRESLLGNVIVADNLVNANEIAKVLRYNKNCYVRGRYRE